MTTSYPSGLDSFTNPTGTDELDDSIGARTHSGFHADTNDAIEAIETELGTDPSGASSTVGDRITATETVANGAIPKTLVDAKGDLIVGSAADTAARLAVGTNGQYLVADSAEATGVKWATASGSAVDVVSNVATSRILGRTTAGSGDSEELTASAVKTLLAVASTDVTDFAEAVSDQVGTMVTGNTETGITVTYQDSDNTLDFELDADLAAIAGLTSAADKGIQFTGSGTAGTYDLTAAGKALLDDADASAQRTTLGLAIGTNVQAYDADLGAIAALTSAADKLPYSTGAAAWALADFTASARTLTAITATAGDLIYASGAATWARLAKGTAYQKLRMNSGATAPEWATTTTRLPHGFAINGTISATESIPGFFISLPTGQTAELVAVRYKTVSGTATISVRKNGTGATGFTSLSVTSTAATTDPTNVALASDDYLDVDITAVSSAVDLAVTVFVEYVTP